MQDLVEFERTGTIDRKLSLVLFFFFFMRLFLFEYAQLYIYISQKKVEI